MKQQLVALQKAGKDLAAVFGRLSPKQRRLAVAAAVAGAVLLFVFAIYLPYRANMSALEARIAAKEKEIKVDLSLVASRNELEIEQAKYRAFLVPESSENEENASLLKDIEGFVKDSGVNLLTIKPAGSRPYESVAKKYFVSMELEATMDKLIRFIYGIESSRKPLVVEKFAISPKSRDSNLARVSLTVSKMVIP